MVVVLAWALLLLLWSPAGHARVPGAGGGGDGGATCKTLACEGTRAKGSAAVALGFATTASGLNAVALGFSTTASGSITTAIGSNTTATGDFGTAMGYSTVADCGATEPSNWQACVAMGFNINNTESEALAVSGNVHARNLQIFGADERLANLEAVADAAPEDLLDNVERIRVVRRTPSRHYCAHSGRAQCGAGAGDASSSFVGLLAQQVEQVVPEAVDSGAVSLTLVNRSSGDVLETLASLKSLDVHALLAQLVGAVQALSKQNKALAGRVMRLEAEAEAEETKEKE